MEVGMRSYSPILFRASSLALIACLIFGFPALPQAQEGDPPADPDVPPPTGPEAEEVEPPTPATEPTAAPVPAGATLGGRVFHSDRKTPWATAVVYAVGPDDTVYSSLPADERGQYSMTGLPPASYRIALVVDGGAFFLANPLGVSSSSEFTIDLVAVAADAATEAVPGVAAIPMGYCYLLQGRKGTSFWKSRNGMIVLVASGIAFAFAVNELLEDDEKDKKSASPSAP